MTFERVDEILWILLSASQRAGFIKTFEFHGIKIIGGEGGGTPPFILWNRV